MSIFAEQTNNNKSMMNETDYMIGDLVLYGDIIAKISQLTSNKDFLVVKYSDSENTPTCQVVFFRQIKPIILTADILLKNGFEMIHIAEYYIFTNKRGLELSSDDGCKIFSLSVNVSEYVLDLSIRYVHELQHLLKMCNMYNRIEL